MINNFFKGTGASVSIYLFLLKHIKCCMRYSILHNGTDIVLKIITRGLSLNTPISRVLHFKLKICFRILRTCISNPKSRIDRVIVGYPRVIGSFTYHKLKTRSPVGIKRWDRVKPVKQSIVNNKLLNIKGQIK